MVILREFSRYILTLSKVTGTDNSWEMRSGGKDIM